MRCGRARCIQGAVLEWQPLPLEDGSLDALWTCTVLQHVPDDSYAWTCAELRRVLKPGALVLLFENTHRYPQRDRHRKAEYSPLVAPTLLPAPAWQYHYPVRPGYSLGG